MSFQEINFPKIQQLPSTAVFEISEWTVRDISRMATVLRQGPTKGGKGKFAGKKHSSATDELLDRCVLINDPNGVYPATMEGKKIEPEQLLVGDRNTLVMMQRIISHGPDFTFFFQCQNQICKKRVTWNIDLRRLLIQEIPEAYGDELPEEYDGSYPVVVGDDEEADFYFYDIFGETPIHLGEDRSIYIRHLSLESIEIWKEGNEFEYKDSLGTEIIWKLWTGKDEKRVVSSVDRNSLGSRELDALKYRFVDIDGVEAHMIANWLKNWPYREADRFITHINEIECGLDTDLEVQCPHCRLIQDIEIPLDVGFFSPSTAKKKFGRTSLRH